MNSGNILQRIICKTGRKPSVCKCQKCKNQCRIPCLGTPQDILRLIEAGYQERLKPTYWCVGLILGKLNYSIVMIQAIQTDEGWCIFHKEGLCELHDLGHKPTEGRLSHHETKPENYVFSKGLAYNVAKEWLDKSNLPVVQKVFSYFDISVKSEEELKR